MPCGLKRRCAQQVLRTPHARRGPWPWALEEVETGPVPALTEPASLCRRRRTRKHGNDQEAGGNRISALKRGDLVKHLGKRAVPSERLMSAGT